MTEEEWLACGDPKAMLELVRGKASDRKLRLLVCQLAPLDHTLRSSNTDAWKAIELGERWADGEVSDAEVEAFCRATCNEPGLGVWVSLHPRAIEAVEAAINSGRPYWTSWIPVLLREYFGNPFRPAALDPAWLTSDVVALTRGIYAERAFDRMPILADALQDAGCTNEEVLNHCRDATLTHVRGCWVVDLVLDKE